MRPLTGFVTQSGVTTVRIQLSDGGVITVPARDELERGVEVEVDYDHTKGKACNVWLLGKRPKPDEPIGEILEIDNDGTILMRDVEGEDLHGALEVRDARGQGSQDLHCPAGEWFGEGQEQEYDPPLPEKLRS